MATLTPQRAATASQATAAPRAADGPRADLGPVIIDVVTFDTALAAIAAPAATPARTITTANLQQLALAERDPQIAELIASSALTVADGWPVAALAGRVVGERCERVTGSDLLPALLERAGSEGLSVAIVGGRDGAAADLVTAHLHRFPGARAIALDPELPDDPAEADLTPLAPLLTGEPYDIVLLALGSPKSDRLAGLLAQRLAAGTIIGVGAAVDFLTGRVERAPRGWQAVGMEWLWRLAHEPRRLGPRYVRGLLAFVPLAVAVLTLRRRAGRRVRPQLPGAA